ncbi:MAG: restriction endonuclease subunit S [Planctomycetota bacterium]
MELEDQKVALALGGVGNFKRVRENDFVISLRSFQGGIEHSKYNGRVSPAYTVLRPTIQCQLRYFAYLLKSPGYVTALQSVTDGIRDGKSISYEQFGVIGLPIPSLEEQHAIVTFLDRETTKIDALVAEQEKLITLLKEKRQAAISQAVTNGLDLTVPKKNSGVEWLGEVPAHWQVQPLKHVVQLRSGGTPDKSRLDYWDGDIPWASAKDLKVECLLDTADHITEQAIEDGATSLVPAGAVLVVVRGMILARTFPVVVAGAPMAINQDLKAVTVSEKIDSTFLPWLLRGSESETLARLDEAGHGTKALRMEAWGAMMVPVPPLHEQAAIAESVSRETATVDQLVAASEQSIALLQERRAALVSAAVTGQIDVRGSAAAQARAA